MAAAVRARAAAAGASAGGREPDAEPPREYERARCVARIAEVLDSVTRGAPAAPVAA
jgi:hypothetical protein